jgi:predicted nuclease with TOPRIM domain
MRRGPQLIVNAYRPGTNGDRPAIRSPRSPDYWTMRLDALEKRCAPLLRKLEEAAQEHDTLLKQLGALRAAGARTSELTLEVEAARERLEQARKKWSGEMRAGLHQMLKECSEESEQLHREQQKQRYHMDECLNLLRRASIDVNAEYQAASLYYQNLEWEREAREEGGTNAG